MSSLGKRNSVESKNERRSVGKWLELSSIWRIPVYQRHYAWDAGDEAGPVQLFWNTLKEKTEARLSGKSSHSHYLGAILVDNKTRRDSASDVKEYDVVDGQQRLTTIQLALLALIQVAKEQHKIDLREKLQDYIYIDKNAEQSKLAPANFDQEQYTRVLFEAYGKVMGNPRESVSEANKKKSKVVVSFDFFEKKFSALISENEFDAHQVIDSLKEAILHSFDLVVIFLKDEDEAQKVFESLNSYSRPLTTFDLIRNQIFYRAAKEKPGLDKKLFDSLLWQEFEDPLWEGSAGQRKDKATHTEAYIARMLVAKMKKNIRFNRNDIFEAYKEFSEKHIKVWDAVESTADYIEIYKYLAGIIEKNPISKDFHLELFRIWPNKDFYPLAFMILKSETETKEKQRMTNLLESYVVRREVCRSSHDYYNLFVPDICKKIGNDLDYENLREMLMKSSTKTTIFPNDEEIENACICKNFYASQLKSYIFEEIVKHKDDSWSEVDIRKDLTVDHLLPKGWEKNQDWIKKLLNTSKGEDRDSLKRNINSCINVIGNLTLMSQERNSSKANQSWEDSKELLRESPLKMNRDLASQDAWNVDEIRKRSQDLAKIVCERWPREY